MFNAEEKKEKKEEEKPVKEPFVEPKEEEEKFTTEQQEIVDLVTESLNQKYCHLFDPDYRAEMEAENQVT